MSNKKNHRRGHDKIQDNGPTWESPTPSAGCNSTHVAKSRKKWKETKNRTIRRNGKVTKKFHPTQKGNLNTRKVSEEDSRLIERDFLDEIIAERTVKNPKFPDKVKEATKRRQKGDKNEDIS